MADASPFAPTDTYDDTWAYPEAQQPAGHPARLLKALRDKLPEENKSLPKPQFFMDPRATSLVNMVRGSLDTAGRWLGGTTRPDKLKDEDMLGPLGGAGVAGIATKSLASAPARGHLSGFIGPGQVDRLNLTPGSRGSLGALEKAQETWAKGGTDPGALAETWSKHGWAPPESFGAGDKPFSWLQGPDLRIRDYGMDGIAERVGKGERVRYTGQLRNILEPNRDARRLFQAEPELLKAEGTLAVGPRTPWQGYATTAGRFEDDPAHLGKRPMVGGQGSDPHKVESIMMGHELRGHALPDLGGVQSLFGSNNLSPIYNTKAHEKLFGDIRQQERAARQAAYFEQPAERMARHAHILDQVERGGGSPFAPERAPGVMSTYQDRGFVDRQVFNDASGNNGLYRLRDLVPGSGKGRPPLTPEELLSPFRASAPVD